MTQAIEVTARRAGVDDLAVLLELYRKLESEMDTLRGKWRIADGLAEPDRQPLYPQRYAEIMGGRIALAEDDSVIPKSLKYAIIGPLTASEINLVD